MSQTNPASPLQYLKHLIRSLKHQLLVVYFSYCHPDTPFMWRMYLLFILAYALSPIDLIPDFIPIVGQLDELVLVPLMLALALRFLPEHVYREASAKAKLDDASLKKTPARFAVAALIVMLYAVCIIFFSKKFFSLMTAYLYGSVEQKVTEQHLNSF